MTMSSAFCLTKPLRDSCDGRCGRYSTHVDVEDELMVADTNMGTIGQCRAGSNSLFCHVDSVCRAKVGDDEAGAGVDDHRVVAADRSVVENNVVVGKAPDPGRGS